MVAPLSGEKSGGLSGESGAIFRTKLAGYGTAQRRKKEAERQRHRKEARREAHRDSEKTQRETYAQRDAGGIEAKWRQKKRREHSP